ncbi:MAG: hypothetical protein JW958_07945 [Candidatus Eisenbacteria bacterium]|nr:hypothetical protein [Candidatus Eisenbacteria bacterium]
MLGRARARRRWGTIVERRSELFFLAVFALAFLLHVHLFHYTVDDAFISFRYARNLAEGTGLVFNPGERVEGYTNFLWTVLLAAGMKSGLDPLPLSRWLGTLSGLALIGAAWRFLRRRLPDGSLALLAPVPLAASGALALWSGAGLETVPYTLLIFTGAAAATGSDRRSWLFPSALFALAALTRPEGALIYAVVTADRMAQRRLGFRRALPGLLLFLAAVGGHEVWRIAYYGDPLPNTFYAKTGGGVDAAGRGLRYLWRYFCPAGGWALLAPLPLLLIGTRRSWERTFAAVLLFQLLYVIAVGGDSLPFFRFLVPALPFLAALAVAGLDRLFSFREGNVGAVRLIALAVLLALPLHASFRGEAVRFLGEDRDRVELHWKVIGRWLAANADPEATIAVTTAGAIPYSSGLKTIDMLGITDRHIARRRMPEMGKGYAGHEKHDMGYVLDRRPDYILHYTFLLPEPVFTTGQFRTPWNRGLEELLTDERFDREYRGRSAPIGRMYFVYFQRKEEG